MAVQMTIPGGQGVIRASEELEPLKPNAFEVVLSVATFGTMAVFIGVAIFLVVRSLRRPLPRERPAGSSEDPLR